MKRIILLLILITGMMPYITEKNIYFGMLAKAEEGTGEEEEYYWESEEQVLAGQYTSPPCWEEWGIKWEIRAGEEGPLIDYGYEVTDNFTVSCEGEEDGPGPNPDPDPGPGPGPGGGGGTLPPPPINITLTFKKYLACFNLSSTTSTFRITIYVQEPAPGTGNGTAGPFSPNGGHAFIGLEQGNIRQQIGFYPDQGSSQIAVGLGFEVPSELHNNGQTAVTVSKTYTVTQSQFQNAVNYINSYNPSTNQYSLYNYNCTNFVYDVANAAGQSLPHISSASPANASPGQLGYDLRNHETGINTTQRWAPASKGPCN